MLIKLMMGGDSRIEYTLFIFLVFILLFKHLIETTVIN